jgi:hypothetical protein
MSKRKFTMGLAGSGGHGGKPGSAGILARVLEAKFTLAHCSADAWPQNSNPWLFYFAPIRRSALRDVTARWGATRS